MSDSLATVLARLRQDPGRPLVTFYDDSTGGRTELSVTTYANWVAKTAGVLIDELDLQTGDGVRLALPPTWLGPVFLGAVALAGLGESDDAGLVVCGPSGPPEGAYDEVLACSLHPFALPFAPGGLPAGAVDFGTCWPNQPDAFLGVPSTAPLPSATPIAERVLTDLDPLSTAGRALFWATLQGRGSVVWCANTDEARWTERATTERTDREVRA